MKWLHFISVALWLLWSCSKPKVTDDPPDWISQVENNLVPPIRIAGDSTWTIAARMAHYGVPGVSLAVIYEGKIAWTKSYGVMDRESQQPVTDTTLFQAGSISKPVAAYGALKMVELEQFHLDSNVNKYLSSWTLPDNTFTSQRKVTLKHLLNHSGGLTVHGFLGYSPDLPVPTLTQVLDGLPPANSAPIRVDKVPEESFRYSGGGYCIMQQMMIDKTGKTYPEVMEELILSPLGMQHSTYLQPLPAVLLTQAATGYLPDGSMTKGKRHTYPEMAAAGLWTTAEDLAKFAIDIYDTYHQRTNKVLKQSTVQQMLTPFVADFIGLGIFLDKKGDNIYFGHGGWDEGFSSELIMHKDKGHGVVILTNSNHPEFISELVRAVAVTYRWEDYVPTYQRVKTEPAELNQLTGRYRIGDEEVITIYQEGNKLLRKFLGQKPVELVKITDTTFITSESMRPVQFSQDYTELWLRDPQRDTVSSKFTRMKDDEKLPLELVLEGKYAEALQAYQLILKSNGKAPKDLENLINRKGYDLLNGKQLVASRELFKINMELFPQSANTYDSYAEVCYVQKDYAEALKYYQLAYKMDPENVNAQRVIKELTEKKLAQ